MDWISNPEIWVSLLTLTALEIVLGIDNIIFISILVAKLPKQVQQKARIIGLAGAMIMRILLLLSLNWIMGLTKPWFTIADFAVSGRDLILLVGGLFLILKSGYEIWERLQGQQHHSTAGAGAASFGSIIVQIMLLDIVFSLDSVITAVGMAEHIEVMVAAVVIAVGVMMLSAKGIGEFVETHPTVKMLALAFLILIGGALMLEGAHQHISKAYIYTAMGFSVLVELLNMRYRKLSERPPELQVLEEDDQVEAEASPAGGK